LVIETEADYEDGRKGDGKEASGGSFAGTTGKQPRTTTRTRTRIKASCREDRSIDQQSVRSVFLEAIPEIMLCSYRKLGSTLNTYTYARPFRNCQTAEAVKDDNFRSL
jgi:hypothetical protein